MTIYHASTSAYVYIPPEEVEIIRAALHIINGEEEKT